MNYKVYGDELYHYGVLGMKWGIHKARKNAQRAEKYRSMAAESESVRKAKSLNKKADKYDAKSTYEYKSHGTKKYDKKVNKLTKKINKARTEEDRLNLEKKKLKYEYRAERSRGLDKREQKYAERVKVGGNILARTFTTVGSKPYQQYVAMMNAQGRGNTIPKVGAAYAAGLLGGRLGSTAVKALYMRTGEKEYVDENFNKDKRG